MSLELVPMKYSKGPGLTSQEWDSGFHLEKVLSSKVKVTVRDFLGWRKTFLKPLRCLTGSPFMPAPGKAT